MIICCPFDTEIIMKTGKKINQLVYSVLRVDFLLSDAILADEITILQILQHLAQMSPGLLAEFLADFATSQSLAIGRKQLYYLHVRLRISEKGLEQPVIFTAQFPICGEKQPVNIFCETLHFVKQAQIIWNTSQYHVRLGKREPVPTETVGFQIFLCLPKSKRMQMQFVCYPVMKSPVIVNDVVHHPSRGRTADNQFNVLLTSSPTVPEQVKSLYQTRPGRIKTRQFINEYDNRTFRQCGCQHYLQGLEGLYPVLRLHATIACLLKGQEKTGHLILLVTLQNTCHIERKPIFESLRYQISFPDTTTAINRDKFRFRTPYILFKQPAFRISTYQFSHI